MSEMYTSLSVFLKQQFAPVSVLARMWNLDNSSACHVCHELSSLLLAKMSSRSLENGKEEIGVFIHDLHLEYCRDKAEKGAGTAQWHRRSLDGHIAQHTNAESMRTAVDDETFGFNMLNFKPRRSWDVDNDNTRYMWKHLSRNLLCAGLILELGATLLDIRRLHTQAVLGLRTDFGRVLARQRRT